jgi:hypothetical protein
MYHCRQLLWLESAAAAGFQGPKVLGDIASWYHPFILLSGIFASGPTTKPRQIRPAELPSKLFSQPVLLGRWLLGASPSR